MLRWDELVHEMPLPCLRCDLRSLTRADGSAWIDCSQCGLALTWQLYEKALREKLEQLCPTPR